MTSPLDGTPIEVGLAVAMFGVTAILTRPLVAPAARRVNPSVLLAAAVVCALALAPLALVHRANRALVAR